MEKDFSYLKRNLPTNGDFIEEKPLKRVKPSSLEKAALHQKICCLNWVTRDQIYQKATRNSPAPYFEAVAHFRSEFYKVTLDEFKNSWNIMYFFDLNHFNSDCLELIKASHEIEGSGIQIFGVSSCGNPASFDSYLTDKDGIDHEIPFPIISDFARIISTLYGALKWSGPDAGAPKSTLLVIDPNLEIKLINYNDMIGVNYQSILQIAKSIIEGGLSENWLGFVKESESQVLRANYWK